MSEEQILQRLSDLYAKVTWLEDVTMKSQADRIERLTDSLYRAQRRIGALQGRLDPSGATLGRDEERSAGSGGSPGSRDGVGDLRRADGG